MRIGKIPFIIVLCITPTSACEDPLPPVSCGGAWELDLDVPQYGTATRDLCFVDPNGDPLSYTAWSSNPFIATAAVLGTTLIVSSGFDEGRATVTVTATDPGGLTATLPIPVNVVYALIVDISSCAEANGVVRTGGSIEALFDVHGVVAAGYLSSDGQNFREIGSTNRFDLSKGETELVSFARRMAIRSDDRCYLGAIYTTPRKPG